VTSFEIAACPWLVPDGVVVVVVAVHIDSDTDTVAGVAAVEEHMQHQSERMAQPTAQVEALPQLAPPLFW